MYCRGGYTGSLAAGLHSTSAFALLHTAKWVSSRNQSAGRTSEPCGPSSKNRAKPTARELTRQDRRPPPRERPGLAATRSAVLCQKVKSCIDVRRVRSSSQCLHARVEPLGDSRTSENRRALLRYIMQLNDRSPLPCKGSGNLA